MLTILCVATYFKGDAFLREAKQQGCRVLLLTRTNSRTTRGRASRSTRFTASRATPTIA